MLPSKRLTLIKSLILFQRYNFYLVFTPPHYLTNINSIIHNSRGEGQHLFSKADAQTSFLSQ